MYYDLLAAHFSIFIIFRSLLAQDQSKVEFIDELQFYGKKHVPVHKVALVLVLFLVVAFNKFFNI